MRNTLMARSAVAVASLAIGAGALAAVPATAATPSGVTRSQILTVASAVRAAGPQTAVGIGASGNSLGPAADRALRSIVRRVCNVDPDGPEFQYATVATATASDPGVSGIVVEAYLFRTDDQPEQGRVCTFGALAPVADRSVLKGTAKLTGAPTSALSGDAFTTPAVSSSFSASQGTTTFSASGTAIRSVEVKVADKKTKTQKKAAKSKYDKRLASAKKSYAKALRKAGGSTTKKTAAKKAYKAKVRSAKAKYRYGIAGYKLGTARTPTPFAVSAQIQSL